MPVIQNVDESPSFFSAEHQNFESNDLISSQVDPSQPQVEGLTSYTDPLVVDQVIHNRLANFDPDLYDLSPASHLVRFAFALLGAAGLGGLRRQQTINRLAATMSGAHFLDLDGFWGALFGAYRMSDEVLPKIAGRALDPARTVADNDTWDAVASRDGKFRSRIVALAHAFSMGGTADGVRMAAEAVLGCEVDLIESWVVADGLPVGYSASTVQPNTWAMVQASYSHYTDLNGKSWGDLQGGFVVAGNTPLGNRGEVVVTPKREISDEERIQVAHVLERLAPVGLVVTVRGHPVVSSTEVIPRYVYADSTDWSVSSSVTAYQAIADLPGTVYPTLPGAKEASRPALSKYSGEQWEYSSRVAVVSAYQMIDGELVSTTEDAQYLMFEDGKAFYYAPQLALRDTRQVALSRLGMEGIQTNFPYAAERFDT
jgi:hypothetical protein